MIAILSVVLALPVLASFIYSAEKEMLWLFQALFALLIFVFLSCQLLKRLPHNLVRRICGMIVFLALAVFVQSRLMSFYFQGKSFNEGFFFHFNLNSIVEAGSAYKLLLAGTLVYFFIIVGLAWKIPAEKHAKPQSRSAFVDLIIIIVVCMLVEPDVSGLVQNKLHTLVNPQNKPAIESIAWQELGLHQGALSASTEQVSPGKNLVLIYLESLEEIYTDENIFPGLTPNLNRLSESGLRFNRVAQTEGTGWTVGGMVASQCGTPLLYGFGPGGNDVLQNGFLNKAVCLGDILRQAGYHQVYLGGASTKFAGKGSFLARHGYDQVYGKQELLHYLDDRSYLSGWGLYDESLFAIAEEKFKQLAQREQPFNLTLLTVDTHFPEGDASAKCPEYKARNNSMLDAVHCSDFLVNQFIEKISRHPAWEETLVVLFSDHLMMRNIADQYYPEDYDRQLFFTVLNASEGEVNSQSSHMDVAPTLLHLLGVDHKHQFLAGDNLLNSPEGTTEIDYSSQQRLNAIRFINSNILTQLDHHLCGKEQLVSVQGDRLRIAGREIDMVLEGHSIPVSSLAKNHGLVASFDDEGRFNVMSTVELGKLADALNQLGNTPFLLVARSNYLPPYIRTGFEQEGEISVLIGRMQGRIDYLGGSRQVQGLDIQVANCNNTVSTIISSSEENRSGHTLEVCSAGTTEKNYLNSESGNIHLAKIAFGSQWYSAVLSDLGERQYILSESSVLGDILPEANLNKCFAYFINSELIIPNLELENEVKAMRLALVDRADWRFRVVEETD